MADRPDDWTYTGEIKNPVGTYKRQFNVPTTWNGRNIFVRFNVRKTGWNYFKTERHGMGLRTPELPHLYPVKPKVISKYMFGEETFVKVWDDGETDAIQTFPESVYRF